MAKNPAFDLFELLCQELAARHVGIIADDDFGEELIEDLKEWFEETDDAVAFERAVGWLAAHFAERASRLPFDFDTTTREFRAVDVDYIEFVALASSRRSIGGDESKEFEVKTTNRLARRLTGSLHCVGTPRSPKNNKKAAFVEYLERLGFDKKSLEKRDQDGGFDILWLPPLGAIPLRPVVSFQCKNSYFNEKEATSSAGRAVRTLNRHLHLRDHIALVIFNDYIDESYRGRARGWIFIPLGISDLGEMVPPPVATWIL